MLRYTKNIKELRRSAALLENDKQKLEQAATKKKNIIFELTRFIKQRKERIPHKEDQVLEVKQQMRLLLSALNLLKEDIIELEETIDPLELEIQKMTISNDQVTKNIFICIII